MAGSWSFQPRLKPFLQVDASMSVHDTEALLEQVDSAFVVISEQGKPQTLTSAQALKALFHNTANKQAELTSFLAKLPQMVTLLGASSALDRVDVAEFHGLLDNQNALGIVVYHNRQVMGVIDKEELQRGLQLNIAMFPKGEPEIFGVRVRTYKCPQCGAYARPSFGSDVPECPRNPFHAPPMQPV
jgi:hypothetical protein